jgi:hypothetical protein
MRWFRFDPTTRHVNTASFSLCPLLGLLSKPEEFILVDSMSPAAMAGRADQRRDYNYRQRAMLSRCSTGAHQPLPFLLLS